MGSMVWLWDMLGLLWHEEIGCKCWEIWPKWIAMTRVFQSFSVVFVDVQSSSIPGGICLVPASSSKFEFRNLEASAEMFVGAASMTTPFLASFIYFLFGFSESKSGI